MDKILLNDRQRRQWLFTCDGKGRLCYSRSGSARQILQSDIRDEFDIITDEQGNFHLVVQAEDGSLIYLTYDFSNWKKYVILKSRSGRSVMSGFKLFITGGKVHCFYTLALDGKSMLIHHVFTSSEPAATPDVISYTEPSKSFSCALDADDNIHIFFFSESGVFQYKIYKNGECTDHTLPVEDDIKTISCICDGDIHLLYTSKMKSYYTLIYYNLTVGERKIISFGDSNISSCCIYAHEKSIFVQWRERMRCYQCVSHDNGAAFKKPVHIAESRSRRTDIVRIRSSNNPSVFRADRCIALSDGNTVDILNAVQCIGTHLPPNPNEKNHKQEKNDYNIIEAAYADEIKLMQSKIRENEKEIIRLNTIINALSDKVSALSKIPVPSPASAEKTDTISSENVGEINIENYEIFKNTDIESIDFESKKTFNKE